ncbi:MAG: TerB family tellurite resistance protein [Gemmatimonadetes bacterium]|nr:TerB family tellurite resistance protein [Gemmatimonadota bacterium]MCB9518393.1 TerB family tellurite resistance protein [Gemmatimonadales bacterium]MCA9763574.1 TerB family tellurite resistance protein [Gemmatimonadota bacterium]MCA9767831.1 TerB family tellurite resistance protein [Gemmatimonadota bacterium]HPF61784.1 TerB family tellurite resistance protein [Gemmatimonadales bacterium]
MLDALRRLLADRATDHQVPPPEASASPTDTLQVAACALLLEVAHADGDISTVEREHLDHALQRHFGLDRDGLEALVAAAETERQRAVDHFGFTRQLVQGYDLGQKMLLAEVMWGIILADGHIHDHEAHLVRKLASLLQLEPAYLSEARRSATRAD